jgi:hypothetical protein
MKDFVVSAILIAVGIIGLTNVDRIQRLYDEAYPASAEKSQMLDRCAATGSGFDRFDSTERANCYARLRLAQPSLVITGREAQDDLRRRQTIQH